jgi:hypothetical protein
MYGPHVHRNPLERRARLGAQSLEVRLEGLLLAAVRHVNDNLPLDVVHHRHVLMPLLERSLVHSDLGRRSLLTPRDTSLDGASLDPRHLRPRQL